MTSAKRVSRRHLALPGTLSVVVCLVAILSANATGAAHPGHSVAEQPGCTTLPPSPPPLKPTTLSTAAEAYDCIFAHYYTGPTLDDRELLTGAFAGFTQELDRLGKDQPNATMPALTGQRQRDWSAFAAVYRRVSGEMRATGVQDQEVAAATIDGMVASLHDNHARWQYPRQPPNSTPADTYGLGITTSPATGPATSAPQEALPPLFVRWVDPESPAAHAGIQAGDVIESVNGAPPFVAGVLSPGVIDLLSQQYPQRQRLRVKVSSPVTTATHTFTLTPSSYLAPAPHVNPRRSTVTWPTWSSTGSFRASRPRRSPRSPTSRRRPTSAG